MIEFLPDTLSVSALKKKMISEMGTELANLRTFYEWYFRDKFQEAQMNFIRSLAAYSLFTYVFATVIINWSCYSTISHNLFQI